MLTPLQVKTKSSAEIGGPQARTPSLEFEEKKKGEREGIDNLEGKRKPDGEYNKF